MLNRFNEASSYLANGGDEPRAIAARVLLDGDALCLANNRDEPTPVSGGKTQ